MSICPSKALFTASNLRMTCNPFSILDEIWVKIMVQNPTILDIIKSPHMEG